VKYYKRIKTVRIN